MPRRLALGTLVGAADQALLSAFSLGLSLCFIRLTTKTEFALFALMFAILQLLQSVQNAWVTSPMTTLLPGKQLAPEREAVRTAARRVQWRLGGAVAAVSFVAAALLWGLGDDRRALWALGLGVAGLGVMAREFTRAVQFIQQRPLRALAGDALYVLLATTGVAGLAYFGQLEAWTAMAAIGAAGLLTSAVLVSGGAEQDAHTSIADVSGAFSEVWECARWALPSVVNSWLYANAYLYVVEAMISTNAVADAAASRLFLVPLGLVAVGWALAFRPRAAAWLAAGDTDRVHRSALRSAAWLGAAALAYGSLLWMAYPLLKRLLGPEYSDLGELLFAWLLFFSLSALRSVGMNAMLASKTAFKPLFVYGVIAVVLGVAGVLAASAAGHLLAVLLTLAAIEALLAALIWWHGWPAIRNAHNASQVALP